MEIPKSWKEAVDLRRPYYAIVKKYQKPQTMVHKALHNKLKIEQRESTKNWGEYWCSGRENSSRSIAERVVLLLNNKRIILYGNRVGHQYA